MHSVRFVLLSLILILSVVVTSCVAPPATAPEAAPTAAPEAAPTAAAAAEPTQEAMAEGPRDGGTLNYAYSQQIFSFNPLTAVQGVQGDMMRLIYNRLLDYDIGLTGMVPSLADSYEVSDDGTVVTFRLRNDVTWHDGTPFTAEDVAFTYTIALNAETGSLWAGRLRSIEGAQAYIDKSADSVSGIKVLDDFTVQFTLEQPDAVIIVMGGILSILPKHVLGDVPPANFSENAFFFRNPVGTGPYELIEYVENQYIRFERHENYFRGRPHIEKINWLIIDNAVKAAGLEKGEIDLTLNPPVVDMERFVDNPDFKIRWQPSAVFCNFQVNVERVPKKIRQAVSYAIDRNEVTQEFLLGGRNGVPWYLHFGHEWLQPVDSMFAYDPEKAKALVLEAIADGDWAADRALDLTFGGGEPADILVYLSQQIETVGIKVALRSSGSGAASTEELMVRMNYDMNWGCNEWGPDPSWVEIYYLCDFTLEKGGYNNHSFCDPRVDELFDQGRYTMDQEERAAYYRQLSDIIDEEVVRVPIYRVVTAWVMNKRVMDATPEYYGSMPNYNAVEKWWLSE